MIAHRPKAFAIGQAVWAYKPYCGYVPGEVTDIGTKLVTCQVKNPRIQLKRKFVTWKLAPEAVRPREVQTCLSLESQARSESVKTTSRT